MKLLKKMLVTFFAMLGILFAGVMVCCMVLFLMPGKDVFGIGVRYFSHVYNLTESTDVPILRTIPKTDAVTNLVIESGFSNIELRYDGSLSTDTDRFVKCQANVNVAGFMSNYEEFQEEFKDGKVFSGNKLRTWPSWNYDKNTYTLKLKVVEPKGFFINNASSFVFTVPFNYFDSITVTTDSGSIVIGDKSDELLQTASLKINNNSMGSTISLPNISITQLLTVNKQLGRFVFEDNITSAVNINTDSGSFEFKDVNGTITVNGANPSLRAGTINGNLDFETTSGGTMTIDTVKGALHVESNAVQANINKMLGTVVVISNYGTLNLGTIGEEADLKTNKVASFNTGRGTVTIEKSYMNLQVETTQGFVNVKDANKSVDIKTEFGSIDVKFNNIQTGNAVNIETKNGAVDVENITGLANIVSTGYSNMNLEFDKIVNNSVIENRYKHTNLYVPIDSYKLILQTKKTNVINIDVGSISSFEDNLSSNTLTDGTIETVFGINNYTGSDCAMKVICLGTTNDTQLNIVENYNYESK